MAVAARRERLAVKPLRVTEVITEVELYSDCYYYDYYSDCYSKQFVIITVITIITIGIRIVVLTICYNTDNEAVIIRIVIISIVVIIDIIIIIIDIVIITSSIYYVSLIDY